MTALYSGAFSMIFGDMTVRFGGAGLCLRPLVILHIIYRFVIYP